MPGDIVLDCIEEMSADLANLDAEPAFSPADARHRPSELSGEEAARIRDLELLAGVER